MNINKCFIAFLLLLTTAFQEAGIIGDVVGTADTIATDAVNTADNVATDVVYDVDDALDYPEYRYNNRYYNNRYNNGYYSRNNVKRIPRRTYADKTNS